MIIPIYSLVYYNIASSLAMVVIKWVFYKKETRPPHSRTKSQSYVLGILTSKTKVEYQNDFVPFGLENYFKFIVCADDTVQHKPHKH